MAKKSMIERERKRQRLISRYAAKRLYIKTKIKKSSLLQEKLNFHRQLQRLPRNSSLVRLHKRCSLTGRPRGVFRDFGLSRHMLRKMAHECVLPGITKASW
jgi:small subunit ribosomal protein S14